MYDESFPLLVAISSQVKVQKVLIPDLAPLLRALPFWIVAGSDLLLRTGIVQIGRYGPVVDDRVPETVTRLERVAEGLAV